MAAGGEEMIKQLSDITECCICMRTFTDPRILPCVHTFCLKCLRKISNSSEKTFQEEMACPVCRNTFSIPKTGFSGLQKNFFMAKLVEMMKTSRRVGTSSRNVACTENKDNVESRRNCCLQCKDDLCEHCAKHKSSTAEELPGSGGEVEDEDNKEDEEDEYEDFRRMTESDIKCDQHATMPLEVYCHDCQRIICYKCLVDEQHRGHKGSAVNNVADEFRQEIQSNLEKVSNYKMLSQGLMRESEKVREAAVVVFDEIERAVLRRSMELKELVERHTKVLLDELLTAKKERLKEIEMEKEESERYHTILESSEVYYSEVKTNGSPTDICRVKDEMNRKTNDLGEILSRIELSSVNVSFHETNLEKSLTADDNVVGNIKIDLTKVDPFQKSILVVGLSQDQTESPGPDALRIHLQTPIKVSAFDPASAEVNREFATAVNNNMMFVAGLGEKADEIWKYHLVSGWIKCGTLVHGRIRHCVAFLGDILYICGGCADPNGVLNSVEAFNTLSNKSLDVGKLIRGVWNATCVSHKSSIYVFYGLDEDNTQMDNVQVYNTVQNNCTQLPGPKPRHFSPTKSWKAVQWETSVILVGRWTCFIFDLEMETWQERKHLKADVDYFGLVLDGGNVYVIGGGVDDLGADDKWFWIRHDDVRCFPVAQIKRNPGSSSWKNVAQLPIPALVYASAIVTFPTER